MLIQKQVSYDCVKIHLPTSTCTLTNISHYTYPKRKSKTLFEQLIYISDYSLIYLNINKYFMTPENRCYNFRKMN